MVDSLTFGSYANWSTFIAFSWHLIGQYQILIIAIKEIDIIAEKDGDHNEKESLMLKKLKLCVQHHNIIIR